MDGTIKLYLKTHKPYLFRYNKTMPNAPFFANCKKKKKMYKSTI